MCCELVTAFALGDEGTELDVLDGDLLRAYTLGKDSPQSLLAEAGLGLYLLELLLCEVLVQPLDHTIIGNLGCIGDEGEDRML